MWALILCGHFRAIDRSLQAHNLPSLYSKLFELGSQPLFFALIQLFLLCSLSFTAVFTQDFHHLGGRNNEVPLREMFDVASN